MNSRYQILSAGTASSLEKMVNNALTQGWKTTGMLFNYDGKFYQALEKETTAKELNIKKIPPKKE